MSRPIACLLLGAAAAFAGASGCGDDEPTAVDAAPAPDAMSDIDAEPVCAADRFDWGRGGELMLPGTDCLDCHRAAGRAADSILTIGGTVFDSPDCPVGVSDAIVHIVDAADQSVDLQTNAVGNFRTSMSLVPPYRVSVEVNGEVREMIEGATGSCGSCHREGSVIGFVWGQGPE